MKLLDALRKSKYTLLQKELYKNYVLSCLMDKYNMNAHDARKAMWESYFLDSLIEFPEETMHVDVETTVDNIYFDYKMRGQNEQQKTNTST